MNRNYKTIQTIDFLKLYELLIQLDYEVDWNSESITLIKLVQTSKHDWIQMKIIIHTTENLILGYLIESYIIPPPIISDMEDVYCLEDTIHILNEDVDMIIKTLENN